MAFTKEPGVTKKVTFKISLKTIKIIYLFLMQLFIFKFIILTPKKTSEAFTIVTRLPRPASRDAKITCPVMTFHFGYLVYV